MKRIITQLVILSSLLFGSACGDSTLTENLQEQTEDSKPLANSIPVQQVSEKPLPKREFCFRKADGIGKRDTSIFHILIRGDKVRGELLFKPYKKPSKTGIVKGSIKGNTIQCEFFYHILTLEESETQTWELNSKAIVLKRTNGKRQVVKLPYSMPQVDCKIFR